MKRASYFVLILLLGILIGVQAQQYKANKVDKSRIQTLIDALEKKPTIIHMEVHPLIPVPVVPRQEFGEEPSLEKNIL
tara:strand:+ start:235 stop:468 length:234 start_codon:yes stop_codon:yes gene_type:complete